MAAIVTLRTVWFYAAADPTDRVSIPFVTRIDPTPQTRGDFREYGDGRFRLVLTEATQQTFQLAFDACSPDLTKWIRDHDGVDLWYRDDSGEKVHGSYLSPQISRHRYNADSDVTLTFAETTGSEEV